ncbi:nicotinate-nucleotide--dimethylbenzimidazole phosphoribosyltransferase [Mycolicibacterium austroafricanum]|uniref:Nicotinate-nucleotide--dimethylbenzimidazole phosphoribosyltransferase n=2 Tax=Mycolicibacterium austroafricanum TaxID=39687 RepID=A0ABT8H8N2_MYCAO|nr:nicotinate-nucleotide--dimethylbenzimidazole phosphoribosyltransferase [Mycolicibacterium austroafricanum]MDN4517119.1 nicotinate-nucleotide--dimethylbenzimidazole phosphoribosyltransferase [Mycolicibacterium austroafricanum]
MPALCPTQWQSGTTIERNIVSDAGQFPFDVRVLRAPIDPPPAWIAAAAAEQMAKAAPPLEAPGKLREVAAWIAATQNQLPPRQLINVRLVVFAGDQAAAGPWLVSSRSRVAAAVRAAVGQQSGVNALGAAHGVAVRVLDLSVDDDFVDLAERTALQRYKVSRGSGAIEVEDALTEKQLHAALAAGVAVARDEIANGAQLLMIGDVGSRDATAAAALIAAALGLPAHLVVGTRNSTGGRWQGSAERIDTAVTRIGQRVRDPVSTLGALGGADLAAATAFLITAARCGVPALLEGLTAVAAAVTADRIAPRAATWFTAGYGGDDPVQSAALRHLRLTPLVDSPVHPAADVATVTALPLVRSATAMLIQAAPSSDSFSE